MVEDAGAEAAMCRGRKRAVPLTSSNRRRPSLRSDMAFSALADPVRREILALLVDRPECSAGDVSESIDSLARTSVSNHLRILKTAGLITERRNGRYRLYSVDPNGPAQEVMDLLQGLFQGSLQDAKKAAEGGADSDGVSV